MSNEVNGLREFEGFRLDAEKRVLWHSGEQEGIGASKSRANLHPDFLVVAV